MMGVGASVVVASVIAGIYALLSPYRLIETSDTVVRASDFAGAIVVASRYTYVAIAGGVVGVCLLAGGAISWFTR